MTQQYFSVLRCSGTIFQRESGSKIKFYHVGYSLNSTFLVTLRHVSTRSTCRARAFWLCRACRTTQLDTLDTTSSTGSTRSLNVSCRFKTWRDEPSGIWAYDMLIFIPPLDFVLMLMQYTGNGPRCKWKLMRLLLDTTQIFVLKRHMQFLTSDPNFRGSAAPDQAFPSPCRCSDVSTVQWRFTLKPGDTVTQAPVAAYSYIRCDNDVILSTIVTPAMLEVYYVAAV